MVHNSKKAISELVKIKNDFLKLENYEKVLIVFSILSFVLVAKYIFGGSIPGFNSDTATANILAREQMLTGQFFPKDWIYVDGPWTLFLNVLIVPLSVFTKKQLLLRSIAVLIQTFILIAVLIGFSKKILKDRTWIIYTSIIFSGISSYTLENLFGQAAYANTLIFTVVLFMLFAHSIDSEMRINYKKLAIGCLVLYITCLSGFRQVAIFLLPFCFSVLFVLAYENKYYDNKEKLALFKRTTTWIAVTMLTVIFGFLSFKIILSFTNCNQGSSNPMMFANSDFKNISAHMWNFIGGLFYIFGYDKNAPLFSLVGIINVVKIFSSIALTFVLPMLLTNKFRDLELNVQRLIVYSWSSFLIVVVMFIFCDVIGVDFTTIRYLQPNLIFQIILSSIYIKNYIFSRNFVNRILALWIMLVFLLASVANTYAVSTNYEWINEDIEELKQVLKEEKLTFGYASYWNAYRYSVYFDFDPEVVAISGMPVGPFYHLTSKRFYRSDYYSGKTFIMLSSKDLDAGLTVDVLKVQFGNPVKVLQTAEHQIVIFDYNISERFIFSEIAINETKDLEFFMLVNGKHAETDNGIIKLKTKDILFGPYVSLQKGKYELILDIDSKNKVNGQTISVTSNGGQNVITNTPLKTGSQKVEFELIGNESNVEFVIVNTSGLIEIKEIKVKRIK